MTAEDILENLRNWQERRSRDRSPPRHFDCRTQFGGQIEIIESPAMVQISELLTVRRTWRERLYDWPWTPWQATRQERRWVPAEKALYTGTAFIVHPAFASRLRSTLAIKYETTPDPRTRPDHQ